MCIRDSSYSIGSIIAETLLSRNALMINIAMALLVSPARKDRILIYRPRSVRCVMEPSTFLRGYVRQGKPCWPIWMHPIWYWRKINRYKNIQRNRNKLVDPKLPVQKRNLLLLVVDSVAAIAQPSRKYTTIWRRSSVRPVPRICITTRNANCAIRNCW